MSKHDMTSFHWLNGSEIAITAEIFMTQTVQTEESKGRSVLGKVLLVASFSVQVAGELSLG